MYFCKGVENWNSRRILCLTKPFFSHFVDMLFSVEFCNQLFYSDGCFFNHQMDSSRGL